MSDEQKLREKIGKVRLRNLKRRWITKFNNFEEIQYDYGDVQSYIRVQIELLLAEHESGC